MSSKDSSGILVTGSSGFIGKKLIPLLSAREEPVIALYFRKKPEPLNNVFPVCSDLSSLELLATPLRGVDTVIHLAWENNIIGSSGNFSWDVTSKPELLPPNICQLKNLISAMEKAKTKRIIFLSTLGCHRDATLSTFLKEKYLAEFFVLNSSIPEKIIVRSPIVFSGNLDDKFIHTIIGLMKMPGFYPVPKIGTPLHLIHLPDLGEIIAKLCRAELPYSNCILDIFGEEIHGLEAIFKQVALSQGKQKSLPIKGCFANLSISLLERMFSKKNNTPKIRQFLALKNDRGRSSIWKHSLIENALSPIKCRLFSETFSPTN